MPPEPDSGSIADTPINYFTCGQLCMSITWFVDISPKHDFSGSVFLSVQDSLSSATVARTAWVTSGGVVPRYARFGGTTYVAGSSFSEVGCLLDS